MTWVTLSVGFFAQIDFHEALMAKIRVEKLVFIIDLPERNQIAFSASGIANRYSPCLAAPCHPAIRNKLL
jgi:hypothetical protein